MRLVESWITFRFCYRGEKTYWVDHSRTNLPPTSWARRNEAGIELWLPPTDTLTFSMDGIDKDCHRDADTSCLTMHYVGQKFIIEIDEHDKGIIKKLKRPLYFFRYKTMDVNLQINGLQLRFVEMTSLEDRRPQTPPTCYG